MRILAVEDDPQALEYVSDVLGRDHSVLGCAGGREALDALAREPFDLVLTDLSMAPPDGFEVLRAVQMMSPPPPVVVLTASNTAEAALQALRLGARDYLVKPLLPEQVRAAVAGFAAECAAAAGAVRSYGLAGSSPAIEKVRRLIPALSASREAVLILGETGTGKEVLARALHGHGPNRRGPFVAHNMAATPAELAESVFFGHVRGAFSGASADCPGLFELADGGALFLDEVDSFPLGLQAKLLRALESGRVQRLGSAQERAADARVIAASATDLGAMVAAGAFRADLFYRLRQLEVVLPPLRERPEDIPPLVDQFLDEIGAQLGRRPGVSPAAMKILQAHSWPGNCRELRNAIRSAVVLAGEGSILPGHLPRDLERRAGPPAPTTGTSLREVERDHIRRMLERAGGNLSRAARLLGIDRGTLTRRLRSLGLGHRPGAEPGAGGAASGGAPEGQGRGRTDEAERRA
ncbi:MAG TPA: sigma-54 dependent transcriptional regulator [Candidatus Saccharimonadales bacterium]|nr:sigma-54 dependent transcriptional regulator [Candidatus Saccharimonadales bacterium]